MNVEILDAVVYFIVAVIGGVVFKFYDKYVTSRTSIELEKLKVDEMSMQEKDKSILSLREERKNFIKKLNDKEHEIMERDKMIVHHLNARERHTEMFAMVIDVIEKMNGEVNPNVRTVLDQMKVINDKEIDEIVRLKQVAREQ